MRTCSRCGADGPDEMFAWSDKAKGERRNRCRPCHAAAAKEWRTKNPEKRNAQKARNAARHPDAVRARSRRSSARARANKPDAVRAYQREWARGPKSRAYRRAWNATDKGRASNRRGALRHSYGREVRDWWSSLVDPMCRYCGEPATQVDHVVPVSRGGTHELTNLVPACKRCNCRKGNLDLEVFLERMAA